MKSIRGAGAVAAAARPDQCAEVPSRAPAGCARCACVASLQQPRREFVVVTVRQPGVEALTADCEIGCERIVEELRKEVGRLDLLMNQAVAELRGLREIVTLDDGVHSDTSAGRQYAGTLGEGEVKTAPEAPLQLDFGGVVRGKVRQRRRCKAVVPPLVTPPPNLKSCEGSVSSTARRAREARGPSFSFSAARRRRSTRWRRLRRTTAPLLRAVWRAIRRMRPLLRLRCQRVRACPRCQRAGCKSPGLPRR